MRATYSLILALSVGLAACGQSIPSTAQRGQQTADVLTGSGGQCPVQDLLVAEIATYFGAPAKLGTNAAMGTGCQWVGITSDGSSFVMLQIVDAGDHSPPKAAPGFKKLADVGIKGFVVPQIGGWQAGAIQGDKSINVITSGTTTSEAQTIAFLREALNRTGAK